MDDCEPEPRILVGSSLEAHLKKCPILAHYVPLSYRCVEHLCNRWNTDRTPEDHSPHIHYIERLF